MSEPSTEKHTPGPWRADISPHRKPLIIGDYTTIAIACEAGNHNGPKMAANAHLIAAAPDMLAALKTCRESAIKEQGRLLPSAILGMQAAINKAEGRE